MELIKLRDYLEQNKPISNVIELERKEDKPLYLFYNDLQVVASVSGKSYVMRTEFEYALDVYTKDIYGNDVQFELAYCVHQPYPETRDFYDLDLIAPLKVHCAVLDPLNDFLDILYLVKEETK